MSHYEPRIITISYTDHYNDQTFLAHQLMFELIRNGYAVSSIDIAPNRHRIGQFLEARSLQTQSQHSSLGWPNHIDLPLYKENIIASENEQIFFRTIQDVATDSEYIFIHAPAQPDPMSTLVHAYAHYVISPLPNDATLFEQLEQLTLENIKQTTSELAYVQLVIQVVKQRQALAAVLPQWFVVSETTAHSKPISTHFKHSILTALYGLQPRPFYETLFSQGYTLADTLQEHSPIQDSMSLVAARHELRQFISTLKLIEKEKISSDPV